MAIYRQGASGGREEHGEFLEIGTGLKLTQNAAGQPLLNAGIARVLFHIDGGDAVISPGLKGRILRLPPGVITEVAIESNVVGSIVIDLWKSSWALSPPTVANTITAAAKPTLSTAQKYLDTVLSGWTTAVAEDDVLAVYVNSVTSIQWVDGSIKIQRT